MKKSTPTGPDVAAKNQTESPKKASGPLDQPWLEELREQNKVNTAEEPTLPSCFEVGTLATLLAIHHSIQKPTEKKEPRDFITGAYALVREVERQMPRQVVAEWMKSVFERHEQRPDALSREYSWHEVLTVQTAVPAACGAVPAVETETLSRYSSLSGLVAEAPVAKRGQRTRPDKEFGPVMFRHLDLVNRPAGISMVGSIGSEKGLRNAIKIVFEADDAAEIIARKTLTLLEINAILRNQIKTHKGRIPKVRAKGNTT